MTQQVHSGIETLWRLLKESEISRDPASPLGHSSEEHETTSSKRCMHLHATLALPTIAKIQEQPKCPLVSEWIKTLWYTCVMKHYLAIEKNEILPSATTWLNLDGIMPRETVSTIWSLFYVESKNKSKTNKNKTHNTKNRLTVGRGWRGGIGEMGEGRTKAKKKKCIWYKILIKILNHIQNINLNMFI